MQNLTVFDKPFQEISLDDVKGLQPRKVSEGMFVEYKLDFPNSHKISHSIASFANTHGGWYFVGIEDDTDNVPKSFNGFDLQAQPQPKEHIRNVIVGNLSPIPMFESRLFEVGNNRAILMVFIPQSPEMPHIARDGKIYRRNAEGSDPVPETDRYTIDKMYEAGKEIDIYVNNFCRREIAIPMTQRQGWLEMYFIAYPLPQRHILEIFKLEEIETMKDFLNKSTKPFGVADMGFVFNNFSSGPSSLIARQVPSPSTLEYLTLTFQIFANGNAKVVVPFPYVNTRQLSGSPYENSTSLQKLVSFFGQPTPPCRIVDGWQFFSCCLVLIRKYLELLKSVNWQNFLVRFRLNGTRRHVLYFDSKIFEANIDRFGVPICQTDRIEIPALIKRNFLEEKVPEDLDALVGLFIHIMESLGYPPTFLASMVGDWIEYLKRTGPTR